jgi:hypothetical protein
VQGGGKEGADTLADVAGQGIEHVILLCDGQATDGLIEPDVIAAQCAEWAARRRRQHLPWAGTSTSR